MTEYKYLKKLGEGGFGSVWKVSKDNKILALKKIVLKNDKVKKIALKEVELLKEISDPCQVSLACFYNYHVEGNTLFIEMEYIDGMTLKEFAESITVKPLLYKYLLAIIKDIVPGLQYLHSKGIIHRDIKPENIMIDKNNQPKLIDIGLACNAITGGYQQGCCNLDGKAAPCCLGNAGTPLYMAPESLLNNIYYFGSDVFSLGASLYKAATGKFVYFPEPKTYPELLNMVKLVEIPILETSNIQLNNYINLMLKRRVQNRITTQEIINAINS